ncbi:MAG: class A beta-lactamase-related serine hydrolase [Candidatus Moranbacteria bacterium]|nr:class A beta-lactamase-related serine hydrolase [Candidatus Moranbacteria bacterium]
MSFRVFSFSIAVFTTGVVCGVFGYRFVREGTFVDIPEDTSRQIRQNSQYVYTNPLLECEVAQGVIDVQKENFQKDLESFVYDLKQRRTLTNESIYFRDLNNGPAFGVDAREEFFPASLLKVPVMMAYYRWAESEPGLLGTEILYEAPKDFGMTPTIIPREQLTVGQSYTVEELIRRMIVYSDNQALRLLSSRLPLEKLRDLFKIVGAKDEVLVDVNAQLTVKEYAGFFRILFNSSYLSHDNSEKALRLLAMTDYDVALKAGVPREVMVSHKFGEAGTGDTERQLHDCGIVYFPGHPYLACIMTRGKDMDALRQAIEDTSRFIYDKIDGPY